MNPGLEAAMDNHWNLLQQPSRSTHVSSPYLLLMAALDQGWQVSEPVQRTTIHHVDEPCAYRFVLRRADTAPGIRYTSQPARRSNAFLPKKKCG